MNLPELWDSTNIFNTFDKFNFTIKEDEPLEKEVAVDPEMLGKVFENLLEVTDRKSKGAFYTPREIVHYMCQQSLINYLETNTQIPREDIEKFIQEGDTTIDSTLRAKIEIKKIVKEYGQGDITKDEFDSSVKNKIENVPIPDSIKNSRKEIDKLLKDIKVVDPAVGSGAFPVGMMNEIVKARSILSIFLEKERDTTELKRECIENSLYGVDIMPSAVDICQLRFWLSLVVDETDRNKIKPLPNLDNKIMCGNSLLEEFEGIKLFDESLLEAKEDDKKPTIDRIEHEINELSRKIGKIVTGHEKGDIENLKKQIKKREKEKTKIKSGTKTETKLLNLNQALNKKKNEAKQKLEDLKQKQKEFFNSYDRDTKKELKDEIEKLEWDLIKVTLEEQGNEEALERLDKIMRTKSKPFFLWKLYFAEVFQRENPGFDVVIANPPYGAKINKEDLSLIKNKIKDTTNSNSAALFIDYGKNKWIRPNGTLSYIVPKSLLYSERWFSLVEAMIEKVSVLVDVEKAFERVKLEQVVFVYNNVLTSDKYLARKFLEDEFKFSTEIKNQTALSLKAWVCGVTQNEIDLIQNLKVRTLKLKSVSKTKRGIGVQKFLEEKGTHHVIGGKNIFQYGVTGFKGHISEEIFEKNKKKLEFLKQPKIISQDLIAHIQNPYPHIKIMSALDDEGAYVGLDTVQNTILTDTSINYKFILALLNSKFVSWYTYKFIYCSAIRTMHFDNYYIGKIIFPQNPNQKPFIQLVDQILSITKEKDYLDSPEKQAKVKQLEKEIDKLVYKLYKLTPEEIKIVEEFNDEKKK